MKQLITSRYIQCYVVNSGMVAFEDVHIWLLMLQYIHSDDLYVLMLMQQIHSSLTRCLRMTLLTF